MNSTRAARDDDPLRRVRRRAVTVGALGFLACAVGMIVDREQVFVSWLIGWWFVLGLTLGSLAIVMVHRLTGGPWGDVVLSPLTAAAATMPVVALLALPLAFAMHALFAWSDAGDAAALTPTRSWYLNVPFFSLRSAVYLAIWTVLATGLARDMRARDASKGRLIARTRRRSIVALLAYAITITFAAIDWLMSLTPEWHSTTFGLLAALGQTLSAFAFCVACAAFVPATAGRGATERDWQDMGNLLLMFAMTWAYLAFTQFLIIWGEDLPSEIGWYVIRRSSGWAAIAILLAVVRFGLPLVAMLFRPLKRNRFVLGAVCIAVLAAGWVDVAWLVAPPFREDRWPLDWTDLAALLAIGGTWSAAFTRALVRVGAPARASGPTPA